MTMSLGTLDILAQDTSMAKSRMPQATLCSVASLREGHCADGRVMLVRDTFALVDFGADVDGLLHVRDLAHTARKVDHALALGDLIQVEVHGICRRRKRI